MLKVIQLLANEYKFDVNAAITKINIAFPENNLNVDIESPNETVYKTDVNTPTNTLLNIIMEQKAKENRLDIWKNSIYKNLPNLQSNNIGNVGEMFLGKICQIQQIDSDIDGTKTKKVGGGDGDGIINGKTIEIKTAHCGGNMSYQHELGEFPWHADYMAFIDVDPVCVYMTIFPNFTEEQYKNCVRCEPYFPTRSFCWRKKSGAFKLDTTPKLNEQSILNGNTIKITEDTPFDTIGEFITRIVR
tara:strand:- start:9287 stop:10021 length:735 start_codon:yes stop_codon:yes gene_type:complete